MNFATTKEEHRTILAIVRRAVELFGGHVIDHRTMMMDLDACHSNGCPLNLSELLAADDANFEHDIFGIRRHIDRETGELTDCFVPRYAARG